MIVKIIVRDLVLTDVILNVIRHVWIAVITVVQIPVIPIAQQPV